MVVFVLSGVNEQIKTVSDMRMKALQFEAQQRTLQIAMADANAKVKPPAAKDQGRNRGSKSRDPPRLGRYGYFTTPHRPPSNSHESTHAQRHTPGHTHAQTAQSWDCGFSNTPSLQNDLTNSPKKSASVKKSASARSSRLLVDPHAANSQTAGALRSQRILSPRALSLSRASSTSNMPMPNNLVSPVFDRQPSYEATRAHNQAQASGITKDYNANKDLLLQLPNSVESYNFTHNMYNISVSPRKKLGSGRNFPGVSPRPRSGQLVKPIKITMPRTSRRQSVPDLESPINFIRSVNT